MASTFWMKAGKLLFISGSPIYDDHCCCDEASCTGGCCTDALPATLTLTLPAGIEAQCTGFGASFAGCLDGQAFNISRTASPCVGGDGSCCWGGTFSCLTGSIGVRVRLALEGDGSCCSPSCGIQATVSLSEPILGGLCTTVGNGLCWSKIMSFPVICAGFSQTLTGCPYTAVGTDCCNSFTPGNATLAA